MANSSPLAPQLYVNGGKKRTMKMPFQPENSIFQFEIFFHASFKRSIDRNEIEMKIKMAFV
jgi:hypothetical protein